MTKNGTQKTINDAIRQAEKAGKTARAYIELSRKMTLDNGDNEANMAGLMAKIAISHARIALDLQNT